MLRNGRLRKILPVPEKQLFDGESVLDIRIAEPSILIWRKNKKGR